MLDQEFFQQLRAETEVKVKAYKEAQEGIATLKNMMKLYAKAIEANNQMLALQKLEPVKFER